MISKIARYKVQKEKLEGVKKAVMEFVEAIAKNELQTLYEAYQSDDDVSFVHFMSFPDGSAEKNHQTAAHTMKFVEALYPNCEESPVFTDLKLVRSTREV